MKVNSLGFRTDLMLRAMGGSRITDHGTHLSVHTPDNSHYWWGNYLLVPPGSDPAYWAKAFAAEFPEAGHLAIGVDATDSTEAESFPPEELARLDLTVQVDAVLTARALLPPTGLEGAEIRPLDGDEDWALATELRFATEDSADLPEHRAFLTRKLAEYRSICEAGHGAWFGAFVEGRMRAGAGVFSDGGGPARFQNVETHPGFRRRGLAGAVVRHAGAWALTRPGVHTLVIVADPGYHAIRLYRTLGFTDAQCQVSLLRPAYVC
ncbi:GNAT family N-acetyltransferase [Streptomyces orinoci]|uniref:GNAT family N-acetyltransferase n=1 Tax=Streptomyces orinoci TaxID=67339 RepID=A0ABV3JTG5_STRON|nr:GNAT family N-acetyltransferase [Streptomyces orinoci]